MGQPALGVGQLTEGATGPSFVYSGVVKGWIAGISGVLLLLTLGLDLITPQSLVLAILYNIPIALSTLALSQRLTLSLAVVALIANLMAAYYNAGQQEALDSVALGNRVLAALSFVLVATLSLRAAQTSAQASEARAKEHKAHLEHLLRRIIEELSGSLSPKELLEHSCRLLQTVLEARGAGIVEPGNPRPVFQAPPDWQLTELFQHDPPSLHPPVWWNAGHWIAALKPQLWLVVQEPQFGQARAVLMGVLPTLQALLGKAELFERTQLQQGELARRSGVIRDLVYAFSHDLRTPLMANALNMRLALEGAYGPMPEAYRENLQHGLEANQELLEMAESLLLLARLESNEPSNIPVPLDLAGLVHEVIERLQGLYREKGVELNYQGPEHLGLSGREAELKRLLQNLLDNALKFSPSGSTVRVVLMAREGWAILQVMDEGKGVSKELRPKLFSRFSDSEGGGSGLGLYVCKQIVLAHQGRIHYREGVGGGSLFEVELPL